ncbi:MAG: 1-acyl-sn-glycerol-3-phosphate acyltransferase [Anaerolineae bacterium]|jgi:hypothetical protein
MATTWTREPTQVEVVRRFVTDEFAIALGLSPQGWARRLLDPILRVPGDRFAQLATELETRLTDSGFSAALHWLQSQYVSDIAIQGAEHIPRQGPLLVAANHPGGYDGLAILANLGRDDSKIVISDVPLTRVLPQMAQHMIFVSSGPQGRMSAARATIRHLQSGGAILIFPSGIVDPDPDLQSGAEQGLADWSPSLELFLRRIPETQLVVSVVSSVLSQSALNNPLVRLVQPAWRRRKLATFLQISQQLVLARELPLSMRLRFGQPVTAAGLLDGGQEEDLGAAIIEHARLVLAQHTAMPQATATTVHPSS